MRWRVSAISLNSPKPGHFPPGGHPWGDEGQPLSGSDRCHVQQGLRLQITWVMTCLGVNRSPGVSTEMPGKTGSPGKVSHEPDQGDPHPVVAEPRGGCDRDQGDEHRSEVFSPGRDRHRPSQAQPQSWSVKRKTHQQRPPAKPPTGPIVPDHHAYPHVGAGPGKVPGGAPGGGARRGRQGNHLDSISRSTACSDASPGLVVGVIRAMEGLRHLPSIRCHYPDHLREVHATPGCLMTRRSIVRAEGVTRAMGGLRHSPETPILTRHPAPRRHWRGIQRRSRDHTLLSQPFLASTRR